MEKLVSVNINNKDYKIPSNMKVLRACESVGIKIPTFCDDKRLVPTGACRMCIVEIGSGNRAKLLTSCSTDVKEGMVIKTESGRVRRARRSILKLLWINHPRDCMICEKSGNCKLENYSREYDIDLDEIAHIQNEKKIAKDETSEHYTIDASKCISCNKCVRICSELQCNDALGLNNRGPHSTLERASFNGKTTCSNCGACVHGCPVGALIPKSKEKFRHWNTQKVQTTCSSCSVGCQLKLVVSKNKVVKVDPVEGSLSNGLYCSKGIFGYEFINDKNRLTNPLIRKNGELTECSWEEAYEFINLNRKKVLSEKGGEGFAALTSGRLTNEDNYLFQKMVRSSFRTNSMDNTSNLNRSSTLGGIETTLGNGSMTNSIQEILSNETIFMVGSNVEENHSVIGAFIKQAVKNNDSNLIIINSVKTKLTKFAHCYLQVKPKTETSILKGIINYIIENNLVNKGYLEKNKVKYNLLKESVKEYTLDKVSEICGVEEELIIKAATTYANSSAAGLYYDTEIMKSPTGVEGIKSCIDLALICGNIGKANAGITPLREGNNIQGTCDMGVLSDKLPGYQEIHDIEVIEKFQNAWNTKLVKKDGMKFVEMIDKALEKKLGFMYVVGGDPVDQNKGDNRVVEGLKSLDCLVVQDIFLTETAKLADVVLPSVTFAEKDGTFTNLERRVQRVKKAINPIGNSKADWTIFSELLEVFGGVTHKYENSEEIFNELSSLIPQYSGINYERLKISGLQWPCPTNGHLGTEVFYKNL